ncbi:MAG: hypothetical protein AAFV86_20665, partial [Pseudomonadota bacterium]
MFIRQQFGRPHDHTLPAAGGRAGEHRLHWPPRPERYPPGTRHTLFVDALFGTGQNRPLPDDL